MTWTFATSLDNSVSYNTCDTFYNLWWLVIKNVCSFWWWWLIITLLITCSNWWYQTLAQNCNERKICLVDFPHFIHNFHFKLFLTRLNSAQGSTIRTLSNFVIVYLQISVAKCNDLCRGLIHDHIQRTSTVFTWPAVNKMLTTRLFPSFSKVISANRKKPPSSACCGLLLDNPRWFGMTHENRKKSVLFYDVRLSLSYFHIQRLGRAPW